MNKKILVFIFIIVIVAGIVVNLNKDNLFSQKNNNQTHIKDEGAIDTSILKKEDSGKEYVYVLEESEKVATDIITGEEYLEIDYRIPYLNLTGNIAKGINNEILDIKQMLEDLGDNPGRFREMDFTYYKEKDIISLGVKLWYGTRNSGDGAIEYYGWNIDIKNNRLLSLDDICEEFGFEIGTINTEEILSYYLTETGDLQLAKEVYDEEFGESYTTIEIIKK